MSTGPSYAFDIISRTSNLRAFSQRATSRRKLCPELRTPPTRSRTTHVGVGTGHEHGPGTTYSTSVEPPIYVFARQRATSRRNRVGGQDRPAGGGRGAERHIQVDFLGFSYGFRPGRSPHHALDALAVGIIRGRVDWILDADIRDYFSKLDHSWLERFLEHRIADRRVLRLIQKWLRAGVIEDGDWSETVEGTPQGASISTLLAKTRKTGRFALKRVTSKKRLRAKLREVKTELMQRRHDPVPDQGQWLASVVRGHSNYYA
jgi:hypothetical protein